MKHVILCASFLLFTVWGEIQAKRIDIIETRCENQINPLGVQSYSPLFAWYLEADGRNV